MARRQLVLLRDLEARLDGLGEGEADATPRPRVRGDCVGGPRPCPWVGCRHHLLLEVHPKTGRIVLNAGIEAIDDLSLLRESCSLDVADRGEHTLDEIGILLGGISRERVRQISETAEGPTRVGLADME